MYFVSLMHTYTGSTLSCLIVYMYIAEMIQCMLIITAQYIINYLVIEGSIMEIPTFTLKVLSDQPVGAGSHTSYTGN